MKTLGRTISKSDHCNEPWINQCELVLSCRMILLIRSGHHSRQRLHLSGQISLEIHLYRRRNEVHIIKRRRHAFAIYPAYLNFARHILSPDLTRLAFPLDII